MREDDVVAARLRSVLAAPASGVGDQAPAAAPRPARESALGDLAAGGAPLRWSDVIPAWPDDIDLEPLPPRAPPSLPPDFAGGRATVVADGVVALPPIDEPTGGFPALDSATDPFPTHLGDLMDDAEPFRSQRTPAWDAEEPVRPALSPAGAFGGGSPEPGRRFGLAAFDPGRRGGKALAAVALVVIVIAALLAWRARPRVDPVAPPAFDATTPARAPSPAASAEVVVAVGGKVRKPGLVHLPAGARVADALTAAGGAQPGIDVAALNLARKVVDGELIMVGVAPPPGAPPAAGAPAAAGGPLNLNTATLAELDGLPGVGPVLAQRILDARTAQGGFTAVSDLRKVDGIGDARYEQLKDLVTV